MILNADFELGNSNWKASPGVIDNSDGLAHGGTWFAWLDGLGVMSSQNLWQTVTIPADVCSANLSFWMAIETEETTTTRANDRLSVSVMNSSGTRVLRKLDGYSNLNAGPYTQKSFDLSAFKGRTIRLRFNGVENSRNATSFFIDDVSLTVTR